MKLTAIAIIALVLTSITAMRLPSMRGTMSSTTLVENDVMNALKKHDNELSKQIQSLISLSLAQGQYDQIFEVLGEILDDLRSDRSAELTAHGVTSATIQQEIDAFALAWGNARTAADSAQVLYSSLHTQIVALDAQLRQLEQDIVTTTALIETTHQQEQRDQEATRVRAQNHQATLNALDIIIDDLQSIQTNGNSATTFAEIKQVVARMKKIGNTNPLLSLVEFSTTFDEQTLADVIEKLVAIRAHCVGSMEDDAADQVTSSLLYGTLIGTYEASLVTMQADHTAKTTTRARKQVGYDDAFATWESESAKYELNHGLWEGANAAMTAEVNRHNAVMQKINSEIDTVETAISILSNSLGYVHDEMNQDDTYRTDLDN